MRRTIAAWAVHLLTASGAIWGLLALDSVARDDARWALLWMALAMAVDSFDGMLARAVGVKKVLPGFDGTLLDATLDYLNYAVVPAYFVWRMELVPVTLGLPMAAAILLASAYQFCQAGAKTSDHFFKGFPSFWNVAVFYLFFARIDGRANMAILVILCVGVFVPLKWAYPSRMLEMRTLTMSVTMLWGASVVAMLIQYPDPASWLFWLSLSYVGFYAAVSVYLTQNAARRAFAARRDRA
ncbi:MAG TPA: hypothetical protein QGG47_06520 [Acidobacteriota bacterium]|nr:hypothetical protein [Acidobacteriota bacterium]